MDSLKLPTGIEILFVAGFGPITTDDDRARTLYADLLGMPLVSDPGNPAYRHTDRLPGAKYFALWPLTQAAKSCFGTEIWPSHIPVPQFWFELDVANVKAASAALKAAGYTLLLDTKEEPWGQIVTRFLSPEGGLLGLSYTPWMRDGNTDA